MSRLILASASAARARLLEQAGIRFDVRPASVDEDAVKAAMLAEGADGRRIAEALAERKAIGVSRSHPGRLVLGADQVLLFRGGLTSKAGTMAAAARRLRALRGEDHELLTAAVLAKDGAAIWRHGEQARLWMRDFTEEFLKDYLAAEGEEILASVGCYRLEAMGAQLFARIEGDYFSILGLPLLPVLAALRDRGALAP